MSSARVVSASEFDERLSDVCRSIFTTARFTFIEEIRAKPVFVDPTWPVVPIPFEFRIDTRARPDTDEDVSWTYRDEYEPFLSLLRRRGDAEIFIATRPYDVTPDTPVIACTADRDSLLAGMKLGLRNAPVTINVFSASGEWGLCSNGEHDGYSVVGGSSAFMREMYGAYGGIDQIKQRFWQFNTIFHHWPVDPAHHWCRDWRALGWGEVPKQWPAKS